MLSGSNINPTTITATISAKHVVVASRFLASKVPRYAKPAKPRITYKTTVPGSLTITIECPANEPPCAVPYPVVVAASPSTIIFPVASNLRTTVDLSYCVPV